MPQNQTDTTEERDGSALSGLRVLEVADGISGSYCGRLLADVGADVIKVEPPDGGSLRREGPFPGDVPDLERSGMFHYLNAGKRSVVIDLVTKSGMGKLLRLAQEADVLITSYEPEKLRSLTMTYQRLRRANSRLIVTMITPFGFRSPYQGWKTN